MRRQHANPDQMPRWMVDLMLAFPTALIVATALFFGFLYLLGYVAY